MKRSLLLISTILFCCSLAQGQRMIKSATDGQKAASVQPSAAPENAAVKPAKHTRKKKKRKVREISHNAPDQKRIDSIQSEKMKHKK